MSETSWFQIAFFICIATFYVTLFTFLTVFKLTIAHIAN